MLTPKIMTTTTDQPQNVTEMNVMVKPNDVEQKQCEHGNGLARRLRGGGAAKDFALGCIGCFLCFECCEGCCDCFFDIICCPCEMCC